MESHVEEVFESHFQVLNNHNYFEKQLPRCYLPPMMDQAKLNHKYAQYKGAMKIDPREP